MAYDLLDWALAALQGNSRRRVINSLRTQPRTVAEIHRVLNAPRQFKRTPALSRPAVSQALAVLLRAQLVKRRVEGRRHLYQLDRTGLDEVRDYLDGLEDLPGFR